jgi:hypothetical protein
MNQNPHQISTADWTPGIYLLHVTEEHKRETLRLTVHE